MVQLSMSTTLPLVEGRSQPECAGPAKICFPFAGGIVGGSHISTIKLIHRLDRSRFTPLIVLHHDAGQLSEFLKAEGLDFTTLPETLFFGKSTGVPRREGPRALIRACADQWAMTRFLKAHQVRVVHTNEGAMHVSWALPARLAGAKLLWHHRGHLDAKGLRFLAPFVADHIVGVSAYALSGIGRLTRTARETSVVYSPFDVEAEPIDKQCAHDALTSELGIDPDSKLIGFFGHFMDCKRPFIFIEMLACIARARPDLPVMGLMFGSPLAPGIETQLMDRAATLGVSDRVRLMGFRYPSAPLMAGCDIHGVAAVDEPFGRSLIEAMLLGTPVVAAASGGNREAIDHGHNGMLFPADDPAAMANMMIELILSPDKAASISATALTTARNRYSAEHHVAQICAIYQELLPDKTIAKGASWYGKAQ